MGGVAFIPPPGTERDFPLPLLSITEAEESYWFQWFPAICEEAFWDLFQRTAISSENPSPIVGAHPCGINYNIFVQESHKDWPECCWNGEHRLVILSAAKDLAPGTEILRCAQDDTGQAIRLSSPDEPMVHYVGINGPCGRPRWGSETLGRHIHLTIFGPFLWPQ